MGFGGISPWSLLIILVIILLLFGTKRLRNMGSDLGGAFKSFKQSMKEGSDEEEKRRQEKVTHQDDSEVIDVEVTQKSAQDRKPS